MGSDISARAERRQNHGFFPFIENLVRIVLFMHKTYQNHVSIILYLSTFLLMYFTASREVASSAQYPEGATAVFKPLHVLVPSGTQR
jgi:hypothetical protein